MAETVRTGEYAWKRVTGRTSFEYFESDPALSATFNEAMAEHTRAVAPGIIEAHDFSRYGTVADLGGGDGTLLAAILRAHRGPRGLLFDLPAGPAAAPGTLDDLASRVEIVAGTSSSPSPRTRTPTSSRASCTTGATRRPPPSCGTSARRCVRMPAW